RPALRGTGSRRACRWPRRERWRVWERRSASSFTIAEPMPKRCERWRSGASGGSVRAGRGGAPERPQLPFWATPAAATLSGAAEPFSRRGYAVRIAVAETIGAAWALAHFGGAVSRDAESSERSARAHAEALQPLPVEALRLSSDDLQLLREFDVRQIGQLLALP